MKKISPKKNDNWKTPDYVYDVLNEEFNFDFDPCPYCEEDLMFDGLKIDWGQSNFINPPYSRKLKIEFVKKAIAESKKGKLCVLLIPASTDTKLFHDIILPEKPEVRLVKGRIAFCGYNTKGEWSTKNKGQSGSMIVIFNKKNIITTCEFKNYGMNNGI